MASPLWPASEAWQYAQQSIFAGLHILIKGKLMNYLASWGPFRLSTAWWTLQRAVPQVGCLVSKSDCRFDCEKFGIMRLAELICLQHWAERVIFSFAVFLAVLCRDSASISLQHISMLAFEMYLYFLPERCTHVYPRSWRWVRRAIYLY